VNKTFLSYWFTTLRPEITTIRAIKNKIPTPHMFIFGNKIKELCYDSLYRNNFTFCKRIEHELVFVFSGLIHNK
jgi:hypothetical protein